MLNAGLHAEIAPEHRVTLIDLVTPEQGTEYWLGLENFYVITRYNRSSFYAMSVFQLAEAIRGSPAGNSPHSSTARVDR